VYFKPRWYQVLPVHIRPPEEKVEPLENLRRTLGMRDDTFLVALASSPWAVVRAQEAALESLRHQFPDADERRLWTAVVLARFEIKLQSPAPWDPPADEIRNRMESIGEIMRGLATWDDVIRYILEMDRDAVSSDAASPQQRISAIIHP
jgi:hypothetical protein